MSTAGAAIKLSILALVAAVSIVGLTVVLSQTRFGPTATYRAVFEDASGLEPGAIVRVFGVRVGQVEEVDVGRHPDIAAHANTTVVTFSVESGRTLMQGTRAVVRYQNLVGDRYLELVDGPGPNVPLQPGGTIPLARTAPALDLDVLLGGLRPLFEGLTPTQINRLSNELIAVLQGEGGTINALLADAASLTNTLADRDQLIGQVVDHLNAVLATLDERDRQLSATLDQLQKLVSGLAAQRDPLGVALERINGLADTVGDLLVDVRPPLAGTVEELRRTATILEKNSPTVEEVLQTLPTTYLRLNRLGSYGTFFNFYLCSVRIKLTGPGGDPIYTPWIHSNEQTKRCQPS